jgi:YD repeat-containing protein
MKYARPRAFTNLSVPLPSRRGVRVITFGVCFALLLSSVSSLWSTTATANDFISFAKVRAQQNGSPQREDRRVAPLPPRTEPPAANLPNLDEIRNAAASDGQSSRVEAPRPIPSSLRSRKKSLRPGMQIGGTRISQTTSVHTPGSTHASVQTTRSIVRGPESIRSHHARLRRAVVVNAMAPVAPMLEDRVNVALASNGATASASSSYSGTAASGTNNGDRRGLNYGQNGTWGGGSAGFPQWLQIDFDGSKTIEEIDVFTLQDNWQYPSEPTEAMTFSLWGLTGYEVQYWNGSAWVTITGGTVTGNSNVWRKFTFTAVTTSKIRVLTNASPSGWSELTEVEAWGPPPPRTNVALASNGATASASSSYSGTAASGTNNGDRRGLNYGQNGTWGGASSGFPQWLQIDFNGSKTIDEIDVFTLQDAYSSPAEPTEAMTFSLWGLTGYEVQYWNGSAWMTVTGGSVSGNNKVWRKFTFVPITTSKIRVLTNASPSGWSELTEVEAWGTPATSSGGSPSDFAMARLDPRNRTGTGGEDLLSNNFNWNLPLVGLNGRGLDLGLTLSYNSLVWTRAGNYMNFDLDQGSIAPGFRLGFPTIEGPYWNPEVSGNFYLLVTPSGGRVELRQLGNSIVYESKDSTYLQLTDNLNGTMTLRATDGSQLNYNAVGGGIRCNRITDRNGNYITATYKSWGELETVTDTLGRVLTFIYDGNDNIQSITQTWAGQTEPHEWATFGWGTASIGNNFPGLTNWGPNSTTIPVLTQVGLPDGSRYNFEYANTYGQVSTIRHYAFDPNNPNHERSHTTYVFSADGADCPRITQRNDAAEYWTGFNGVPNEIVTQFAHDPDGACRMTAPDGTIYKEYYAGSADFQSAPAWQNGLVLQSEVWSAGVRQKWTTVTRTQDDVNVSYLMNPRVTETNVYDAGGNRRRQTIDYGPYAQWGLSHIVKEYAGDGTTELRRSQTDYHLTQPYLDRRIIGLVSVSQLYDSVAGQCQAKVMYGYDDPARLTSPATTATMHDQSYNSTFTVRGNATSVSRWDVSDINNASKALTSTVSYDAAGSALSTTDPAGHTNSVSYADSFSDGNNARNTFAYPTMLTDADGFSSTVQYNFDFGAKTRVEGPPPQNQPNGAIQTFAYDSAARLQQVTTLNTGAYTRYVYGPYWVQSFSTVKTMADEAYSITTFDGVGRAFTTTTNHPGSFGGYKLVNVIFDKMGRPFRQSNPTEVNSSWLPAGDDAVGVRYSVIDFDWQGRTTRKTHSDGAYTEASYAGCGCAGGEVVTLTDEVGRQQKVYSDVLGRQWKTEVLNWDGSVYSTTTNTLNARDQGTLVRQWAGAEGGAYQDTTMSYDGYGRLQSKHVPEQQDSNGNPTYTTWTYKPDDTVETVTDARGASATYGYNNRHLVTSINYFAPSGITATPNATFGYDAAGNRTLMNDGLGSQSYNYNQLSQMTSETRTFTGLGNFTLGYDYNLAGQLKSLTDPFNATIIYGHDAAGRLSSVTGTSFAGVTSYATGVQYRAWGAVKSLSFGNNRTMSAGYNSRLQTTGFQIPNVINKTYQYFADGNLRYSQDFVDDRFDRSYAYDHTSRIATALSGPEARGQLDTDNRPYQQTLTYDAFNHLTSQTGKHWSSTSASYIGMFTNNRRADANYDADGNVLTGNYSTYTYNSAAQIAVVQSGTDNTTQGFDGNGLRVKTAETTYWYGTPTTEVTYYVRSTVLGGQVITEMNANGAKQRTFVYAGKQVLAWQRIMSGVERVTWEHRDPSNASFRTTNENGSLNDQTYVGDGAPAELDPTGGDADVLDPYLFEPPPEENQGSLISYGSFGDVGQLGTTYSWDGIPMPADEFFQMVNQLMHGRFGMLEASARESSRVVGYRNSGVRWGRPFEVNYDADGRMTSMNEWELDSSLAGVSYGNYSPVYASSAWNELANLLSGQSAYERSRETRDLAFRDVAQVLQQDRDCAKFFGALNKQQIQRLVGTVERLQQNSQIKMRFGHVARTEGKGRSAVITLGQPFFGNAAFAVSKIVPTDPRLGRAETILHEIAHAFGLIKKDGEGSPEDQADKNDVIIMKHCGKGIAKIGK